MEYRRCFYYLGGIPFSVSTLRLRHLCSRADVGVLASCCSGEGQNLISSSQLQMSLWIILIPRYHGGLVPEPPRIPKHLPGFMWDDSFPGPEA